MGGKLLLKIHEAQVEGGGGGLVGPHQGVFDHEKLIATRAS